MIKLLYPGGRSGDKKRTASVPRSKRCSRTSPNSPAHDAMNANHLNWHSNVLPY
jgi:hypothetical protein